MTAFRLSGLRRLRRIEEDRAAAELARRSEERLRAQHRGDEVGRWLTGSHLRPDDPQGWHAVVAQRVALTQEVRAAQAAAAAAQAREAAARDEWTTARQRGKTLDKLSERHDAAERAAEAGADQHRLDELATQRAARRGEQA